MLPSLSKEDLHDLFPGPEHFFRRRTIWTLTHGENEGQESDLCRPGTSSGTCDSSPMDETTESLQNQARHYKTLQEMYKTKARPNQKDISQLLDLEFQARQAFRVDDATKEHDMPTKILQAYPCFRELDHVMDELWRILDRGNSRFILELKTRWGTFYNKAQFYESAEDPNTFLQERPLFSPVAIVCETNCILAIGTMPVVTFGTMPA